MIPKQMDMSEFYEIIETTCKSNNYISTVKVEFYDGTSPVKMMFESPKGFEQYQEKRTGIVTLLSD